MNLKEFITNKTYIEEVLKKIGELADESGLKIFAVGGYVRDRILLRERDEVDISVEGDSLEFANKVAKYFSVKDVALFKNFGTAAIKVQDIDIEFVTTRKESYNHGSRKPEVEPGSFQDDISRRDFTINTLAIPLNKDEFGNVIDTFNGLKDIEDKIIKTPLDPEITFSDDPLRIMRAFRFASQLQFQLSDEVYHAIQNMHKRLEIVSKERIVDEFFKIMLSEKPSWGLSLMFKTGVMQFIYPEIAQMAGVEQRKDAHHKDVFWHTLQVVDNISRLTDDLSLRLAALFHDIAKPLTKSYDEKLGWTFHGHEEIGARIIKRLFTKYGFPLNNIDFFQTLIRLHLRPIALVDEEVTDSAIRRLIVSSGEYLEDLITLCRADITSKNQDKVKKYLENYDIVVEKIHQVNEKDKLRNFQSPVRGEEIMEIFNLKPSKEVGIIKEKLEDLILEGIIPNEYDATKEYLMKNLNSFKEMILNNRNKSIYNS